MYFKKNKRETDTMLQCLDALSHRGPDDSGYFEDEDVFLGSKRLSIIDLSRAGHMPMSNRKKNLWIIFNGEVYNYLELRKGLGKKVHFVSHSDTEVVLHLFERHGPSCLQELRGMFAFAIWDTENKQLFLARDHLGKKPLKFHVNRDGFTFASELKAILRDPSIPREIDPVAVHEFLTYQYVPSPRTGFMNICKLEPGHFLVVNKNGKIDKRRYWHPQFLPKLQAPEHELRERIHDELKESVKIRLRSDVPLAVHLSGGIDSSLILALMNEQSSHPIRTFSVGFDRAGYDESNFAHSVAKKFNTIHQNISLDSSSLQGLEKMLLAFEEPYADPSLIPTWFLCEETKKEATVALNGDGGDEIFGGYQRYMRYKMIMYIRKLPFNKQMAELFGLVPGKVFGKLSRLLAQSTRKEDEIYPSLFGNFGEGERKKYYSPNFMKEMHLHNPYAYLSQLSRADALIGVDKLLNIDLQSYLPEDLLVKSDIAGMAHSLEIRSPFLDQKFLELAMRLPHDLKLQGFSGKLLLKRIAEDYLPREIIRRKKQGFGVPLEFWLNSRTLKNQVQGLLHDNPSFSRFINKSSVRALVKRITGNGSALSRRDTSDLWLLLCLKTWIDVWFP